MNPLSDVLRYLLDHPDLGLRVLPLLGGLAAWLRGRRRPVAIHPSAYNSRAALRRPDGVISPLPLFRCPVDLDELPADYAGGPMRCPTCGRRYRAIRSDRWWHPRSATAA
jgi:hypothetical protein